MRQDTIKIPLEPNVALKQNIVKRTKSETIVIIHTHANLVQREADRTEQLARCKHWKRQRADVDRDRTDPACTKIKHGLLKFGIFDLTFWFPVSPTHVRRHNTDLPKATCLRQKQTKRSDTRSSPNLCFWDSEAESFRARSTPTDC